jgi:solute:Na+ symporter, SSS family
MNGALAGIAAAALLALGLGFLARRGRPMGLGQWTVAGRSFGAPLVFLLMAGEIYTTFAFLGGSGFATAAAVRSITFFATPRSPT